MRIKLAQLASNIINPFLVSLAVIVLLSFEASSGPPEALKWASISIALSVLPVFSSIVCLIHYRKLDGIFVNPRRQRNKIYVLASCLAVIGWLVLRYLGAPVLLVATFVAGLAAMVIFMMINLVWKISLHTGFVAASVSILFIVYGYVGASAAVLLPPVAWARVGLAHHSWAQVALGAVLAAALVVFVFFLFGLVPYYA